MTYAIFKVSWNPTQSGQAEAGICGTAFFINKCRALTAHHVLNSVAFNTPNRGFSRCRYWLLGRDGGIVDCNAVTVTDHPEIDVTVLSFDTVIPHAEVLSLSAEAISPSDTVSNQGYREGDGNVVLRWAGTDITIDSFDLRQFVSDGEGTIESRSVATISTSDVNLRQINVLKLSYGGSRGMSGGPLLVKGSPRAVGLMSFGLPPDVPQKQELYAVAAEELLRRL